MNQLVQSIIQPFTEQQMKSVALVPGGYKPPTSGHFYLVNEMAKRSEINEVVVLIGHKVRDGITAEQSLAIWEIYKKHLPTNVTIHIAEARHQQEETTMEPIKTFTAENINVNIYEVDGSYSYRLEVRDTQDNLTSGDLYFFELEKAIAFAKRCDRFTLTLLAGV